MINIDELRELEKKADVAQGVSSFTTKERAEYISALLVNAPALLDELEAARSENEQLRESKSVVKRVMCQTGVEKELDAARKVVEASIGPMKYYTDTEQATRKRMGARYKEALDAYRAVTKKPEVGK